MLCKGYGLLSLQEIAVSKSLHNMVAHDGILPQGGFPVDAFADAVLGHISDMAHAVFPAVKARDVLSIKEDFPPAAAS